MTYAPLSIQGDRRLSDAEIARINSIKTHGDALGQQIAAVMDADGDLHWATIAEEYLQIGIMALCRAVAKPEGF